MSLSCESVRASDWEPVLGSGAFAEAYLEESGSLSLEYEDSRLSEVASSRDAGTGLRWLRSPAPGRWETLHGSFDGFDPAAARALRERLLPGAPARSPRPPEPWRRSPSRPLIPHENVALERKARLLGDIDRIVRSEFPHLRQVHLLYAERARRTAWLGSEGPPLYWERVSTLFMADVTAARDGILQSGHEVLGAPRGFELLEDDAALRAARAAAKSALAKLDAPCARAGEMPVVLAASAGGTFIHEAIGHSLEADHVQEGSSPHYAGKLGKRVAPEFLSVIDDPTLPFARGSYAFDDEGVSARATPLVRRGVLEDFLSDRLSALRRGGPSNGHGRRESFRHRPIPRMSNLYIAPGTDDPSAILRELKRGILVTKMGGGQVNTATGEFVFEVDEGYWVEGGKVRHRVRDANMLGTGPEALASIDRLGYDIGWGIGTCGKEGQGVPVSDGQPTLRIPKILIGGRAE